MCGIFGIINHHKRLLDKRAFITLGCANDSRGGDACGIMIDGKVDKGTEKDNKYFQFWFKESSVLKDTEKCYVALGHCRKASVGGITADKAQPVTIYDENNKLLFCVIHNGTIYNYESLAKKYIPTVDIKGLSDSQVMARIFFEAGYDVLQEYEGGGAFVIQDYRSNETFIFRGESRLTYNAKSPSSERPLYFVETGKSIIFSSLYAELQGLYWGFTAYDMPSNVLLKCDGQHLYKVKEYDRSECFGYKSTVYDKKNHSKSYLTNYYGYSYGINDFTEKDETSYNNSYSKIKFDSDLGLYINEENKWVLHGEVNVSCLGRIINYESKFNTKYYFWSGIMLSGENAYIAIRDFFKDKNHSHKQVIKLAKLLSCNPVMTNKHYFTYDSDGNKIPFTDSYIFPLTNLEVICNSFGKKIAIYEDKEINKFVPVNLTKEQINKFISHVEKSI